MLVGRDDRTGLKVGDRGPEEGSDNEGRSFWLYVGIAVRVKGQSENEASKYFLRTDEVIIYGRWQVRQQ